MATAKSKTKAPPFLYRLFGPPSAPGEKVVERYSKSVRVLHWVNAVAWVVLFITGWFFVVDQFGAGAREGISGVFHRIAAVVMIGWAVLFVIGDKQGAVKGIKEAFKWGKDDLGWVKAAPAYYILGEEGSMPPQDHMNTGQKLWWLVVLLAGSLMIITGALMWFFKPILPQGAFLWTSFFHDVGFFVLFSFALIHVYLSVMHPLMRGVFWSMWSGKISAKYAESHHKKWYDKIKNG
jgi:formate dehydrogenase subunit gamma